MTTLPKSLTDLFDVTAEDVYDYLTAKISYLTAELKEAEEMRSKLKLDLIKKETGFK